MVTALAAVNAPHENEYSPFFKAVLAQLTPEYVGCDVLITSHMHTSTQFAKALLSGYSQFRQVATENGLSHDFSINFILVTKDQRYERAFKVCGEPVSVDVEWTEVALPSNEQESVQAAQERVKRSRDPESDELGCRSVNCVAVGGTFDHLHDGHKILLLLTAFCAQRRIIVGVTGEQLLKLKKFKEYLEDFSVRVDNVSAFLQKVLVPGQRFEIYQMNDVCGPTGYIEDIDALAISEETRLGAAFVNARRTEQNFRQLKVVCAHIVGGDGNELTNWQSKLSSTDLREREAKARRLS
ncbi:Nucleotidylyl transferase [Metschnikowia bicuspidata]|uniref:Nucleotidylyl transferase n=1 Tax=Metschnikowia bicuspidata TaxID=27322 RepID=A0A4P9ZKJ2_9ASCO|nr:Nucleotidylyl transferase [Metschnikowia bicuspidata]